MAVKAKQQYYADETTIKKEAREFGMIDELKDKLDSIEYGAQVNIIEEVQENGVPLEIVDKSVNVLVPEVIDNLYTIDPNNSLSAKQGKILYDMIKNLLARGRFLSTWNTATGLPVTNPEESPYEYKAGDYYIVGIVAAEGGTNFRPEPGEYVINVASDEQETSEVHVSDIYVYDGEKWILLINSTRELAVDDYVDHTYQSTNPVENQAIAREIDTKQNKFYTVSTTSPSNPVEGDEWYDATNDKVFYWDGSQWKEMGGGGSTYTAGLHISIDQNDNNKISVVEWSATSSALGLVKLGSDIRQTITPNNVSDTVGRTYKIQANSNGQLMVNVPWTDNDTTYTAGDGISIDTSNNNRISCTVKPVTVGPTAPATPGTGDLWYDTTKNTMFLYKNNAWTIIGPEIYPITKADYEALTPAEQGDGRFFLITDNDGTIYVDWDNVQNRPMYIGATAPSNPCEGYIWYDTTNDVLKVYDGTQWNEVGGGGGGCCYTAGNGIDITNDEISIDTTVVATKTDLNSKQDTFHTTSTTAPSNPSEGDEWYDSTNDVLKVYDGTNWIVTGKTYTAGNGINIDSNNEISVDTTVVATKTDLNSKQDTLTAGANITIAQDGTISATDTTYTAGTNIDITNNVISADTQFVVVDTLPAVATADVNKVYILGPIGSGADKYEEYIVQDAVEGHFESASTIDHDFVEYNVGQVEYGDRVWNKNGAITNKYVAMDNLVITGDDYLNIGDDNNSESIENVEPGDMPYVYENQDETHNKLLESPYISTYPNTYGSFDIYYSDSEITWVAGTPKQYVKIGETSPDLSGKQDKATSGSGAPSTAPSYIGQMYVDTTNDNLYVATGTSSSSDWTAVDTNTTYTAGDGIDIDANNEISVDVTDIIGTGLSEDNSNNIIVDTTVIQEKLTAGDGIDIDGSNNISVDVTDIIGTGLSEDANNNLIVDSTVVALKSDLTNYYTKTETYTKTEVDNLISSFGNFEVVASLPSVSTASEKTIYLLGPIGTGADKYEEWIVTNETGHFESASTITHESIEDTFDGEHSHIWNEGYAVTNKYIGITNFQITNGCVYVTNYAGSCECCEITNNTQMPFIGNGAFCDSTGGYEYPDILWCDASSGDVSFDLYYSDSPLTWNAGGKVWTKIGETSVDLSGYATTTALTNGLATKQDTLTAGDGIDIDANDEISVDVTDIISTGLSEDANNNIIVDYDTVAQALAGTGLEYNSGSSAIDVDYDTVGQALAGTGLTYNGGAEEIQIDTTVVATQTDLSGKQDKATSGSTAPSTTPSYVGQQYIDTTNDKMYVATGATSSSDWTEVGAGSGDMLYSDFGWDTLTGASVTLALRGEIEPSVNFTVNKPNDLKDGQFYVLRVDNGATAYTMTLGTGVTNPYSEDLTLVANNIQQFMFLAKGGNLELQPSTEIDISGKQDKATSGSTAPSSTPSYIGQQYVDTTNDTLYVATGTTSSSDWTEVGAGGGFEVVSALPSVAQADENKIYVLGPIGTGTDKYEEWIVTEEYGTSGTTDSVGWAIENQVGPTINYVLTNYNQLDGLYLSLNNVGLESGNSISSISFGTDTYTEVPANLGLFTYGTSPARFSIEFSNVPTDASVYSLTIDSSTSAWVNQKQWTKIGETSINAGDMLYADFNWVSKTGATVTLDINSTITPSANFTVNAPSTIKDGQVYILRVINGATAYTMTLGTGITNPYSTSTALTANGVDQFVFQAIGGNLELLPDSEIDISGKQDKATSSSTAPAITPSYIGQQHVDTTNDKLYVATGTSSSSDWMEVGAGGGNVIAMTQSEYNALSTAEKNDGKLRIITDAPTEDISIEWSNIANRPGDLTAAQIQAGSSTISGMVAPSVIAASMPILSTQTGALSSVKIWVGTQSAYEALATKDANTLYFTTPSS